jgi:hypothetical protein
MNKKQKRRQIQILINQIIMKYLLDTIVEFKDDLSLYIHVMGKWEVDIIKVGGKYYKKVTTLEEDIPSQINEIFEILKSGNIN